jgi:hypothetical protein
MCQGWIQGDIGMMEKMDCRANDGVVLKAIRALELNSP